MKMDILCMYTRVTYSQLVDLGPRLSDAISKELRAFSLLRAEVLSEELDPADGSNYTGGLDRQRQLFFLPHMVWT